MGVGDRSEAQAGDFGASEELAADRAAVQATRAGDRAAFGLLVTRHLPRLHALLQRFLRQPADVDDVAQTTFLRAYEQLARYDIERPFYPWLRKIAVNLALNELDRRRRRPELADPELALEQLRSPLASDAASTRRELIAAVDAELAQLPAQWAAVFRLRVFEELSYAEIAATLELPMGTVMSSLARARLRLAERLGAEFGPGGSGT